jgi:nodulation protein E
VRNRVVITGLGCISGLGKTIEENWQNVLACKSGIDKIQGMDLTKTRISTGSQVKNYDPLQYFTEKELEILDKFAQFSLIAAKEAVKDSGIEWTDERRPKTCVITGTGIGGQDTQEWAFNMVMVNHTTHRNALFTIPRIMPNAGASQISMEYGITGPGFTISTACASSNHAIGNAYWFIRSGLCNTAITGGSETPFSLSYLKAWEPIRVVSPDTCRPFSKGRQGMILGEGGAMMILESLESAQKRGAKIYAEIIGFGMTSDASHITKPNGKGAESAMRIALEDASISPDQVDYINTHGTGTLINDAMETASIKNIFGEHAKKLAISSTKSLHGHVLGGTSAVEAVITAMGMHNQVFPPTANFLEPDPECDLDVVPNAAREGVINYALSNSFAFGGLNAVIALKRWTGN